MSEEKANYTVPVQVTNYDTVAEMLAGWRAALPPIVTVPAYMEAVKLYDALILAVEGFEMSAAFKRITGAQ